MHAQAAPRKRLRITLSHCAVGWALIGAISCTTTPDGPKNQPPVILGLQGDHPTMLTAHPYSFTIQAQDPDDDPLTFSVEPAGPNVSINGNVITLIPQTPGTLPTYTVKVKDGRGGEASRTLPTPPVIRETEPKDMDLGELCYGIHTYQVTLPSTDADGDTYTYSRTSGGTLRDGAWSLENGNLSLNQWEAWGQQTLKLAVQQHAAGLPIGTPTIVTLSLTTRACGMYPTFVAHAIPASPFYVRAGQVGGLGVGTGDQQDRPIQPAKLLTVVANDADGDQIAYSVQWVTTDGLRGRFFSSQQGASAYATKLGRPDFVDDLQVLELDEIPTQEGLTPIAYGFGPATRRVTSGTPLDVFFVPSLTPPHDFMENPETGLLSPKIRILAVDQYNTFDPHGYVIDDAQMRVKDNTPPVWPALDLPHLVGVLGDPAPTSDATSSTLHVSAGVEVRATWSTLAKGWDQGDGTLGDYPLSVITGGDFAGVLDRSTLDGPTSELTWIWTPPSSEKQATRTFTLKLKDASGQSSTHTVTLVVH